MSVKYYLENADGSFFEIFGNEIFYRNDVIIEIPKDEALSAGRPVSLKEDNGSIVAGRGRAPANFQQPMHGIALQNVAAGPAPVKIKLFGMLVPGSSVAPGRPLWLANGDFTNNDPSNGNAGDLIQPCGVGIEGGVIYTFLGPVSEVS